MFERGFSLLTFFLNLQTYVFVLILKLLFFTQLFLYIFSLTFPEIVTVRNCTWL